MKINVRKSCFVMIGITITMMLMSSECVAREKPSAQPRDMAKDSFKKRLEAKGQAKNDMKEAKDSVKSLLEESLTVAKISLVKLKKGVLVLVKADEQLKNHLKAIGDVISKNTVLQDMLVGLEKKVMDGLSALEKFTKENKFNLSMAEIGEIRGKINKVIKDAIEARKRAEEERKRAEEERKRAEEERMRTYEEEAERRRNEEAAAAAAASQPPWDPSTATYHYGCCSFILVYLEFGCIYAPISGGVTVTK